MAVDVQRILDLGMRISNLVMTLAQKRQDISVAIKAGTNIFSKRAEDITEADLDESERILDEQLDKAAQPMTRTS